MPATTMHRSEKISDAVFTDVESALAELRAGHMVVVCDDEDRENEGDLTMAAEKVTPEAINFMTKYGRGLVCLALPPERLDYLRLPQMSAHNTSQFGTAFTESIDAIGRGVTTGISAYDRATTILTAIDPSTRPSDLAHPGHIFPLRARKGGVLVRSGQTEAAVDLARLAGMVPAGVICEVMNDDGSMARVPDLVKFCRLHGMKMLTVADLIRYRMAHERLVHRVGESQLHTEFGEFRVVAYGTALDGESHMALIRGDIETSAEPVLVRMHRHCMAGDLFASVECECGRTLRSSMAHIAREGAGAVVCLYQNSLGFSTSQDALVFHSEKSRQGTLEDQRRDQREIGIGAQILLDLKIKRLRLLTNHPRWIPGLDGYGLEIVDQLSPVADRDENSSRLPNFH
jgi:3,4-dihydroxy 2-butanone 4-phosphate synthase/GTP cyclohydrolase II